jgi:hypothetical protein
LWVQVLPDLLRKELNAVPAAALSYQPGVL